MSILCCASASTELGKLCGVVRMTRLEMALQADGVKRHAGIFELRDQPQEPRPNAASDLVLALGVGFVEHEFCPGVDFRRTLERAAYIVRPKCVVPRTEAVAAGRPVTRPERLVDDVPGVQHAGIAADDLVDIAVKKRPALGPCSCS